MATKKSKNKKSKEAEDSLSSASVHEQIIATVEIEAEEEENEEEEKVTEIIEPIFNPAAVEPTYEEPLLLPLVVTSYDGCKCKGLFDGFGTATFIGGHYYSGEFFEGRMHGRGVYQWADGVVYEGDFCENKIYGQGSYTWKDGSTYSGEVENGLRHGRGTFCKAGGMQSYTGTWSLGVICGRGKMSYDPDGNSFYDGLWVNGKKEGFGYRRYPTGNVYEGCWLNDVRHGKGTMHWYTVHEEYSGEWVNGIQHGYGEHIWYVSRGDLSQYSRRNTYKGEFCLVVRQGHGTFFYANGTVYEGEWVNNYKHGKGKFIFKNGRVFEGEFKYDRIVDHPDVKINGVNTPDLSRIKTRTPLPSERAAGNEGDKVCGPKFDLNVEVLPGNSSANNATEIEKVMNIVLQHITSLNRIYNFYNRLGCVASTDNTYALNHLQFSRMLKDCCLLSSGFGITDANRWLAEAFKKLDEICVPGRNILFVEFVHYLIIISHHLLGGLTSKGCNGSLSNSFSIFMNEYMLRRACCVKDTRKCLTVLTYCTQLYDIYTLLYSSCSPCGVPKRFTMRNFLLLLNDLNLLCCHLTSKSVIEVLSADDPRVSDEDGIISLEYELSFLEFLEALVGCAEVSVTCDVVTAYYAQYQPQPSEQPEIEQTSVEQETEVAADSHEKIDQDGGKAELDRAEDPRNNENTKLQTESEKTLEKQGKKKKQSSKSSKSTGTPTSDPGSVDKNKVNTPTEEHQGEDVNKSPEYENEQEFDEIIVPEPESGPVLNDEERKEQEFVYWCSQIKIFIELKFIPAAQHYLCVQQRIIQDK